MEVKIITDIATEPVTLAEVKQFLQMDADYAGDDALLTAFLTSARIELEQFTGLSFAEKSLKLIKTVNGCGLLEIPCGPVLSITSVVDKDGSEIDYDTYGEDHPKLDLGGATGQIQALYTAGFDTLPEVLKTAIKLKVKAKYDGLDTLDKQALDLAKPLSRNLFL